MRETYKPYKIRVYQDAAGLWRWRAISGNGKIVADSGEGYSSRNNATRALRSFMRAGWEYEA